MTLQNSDTIAQANINNLDKVENLSKLVEKVEELRLERRDSQIKIKRIYKILFKDFSSKRVITEIKFNESEHQWYKNQRLVFGKEGFYVLYQGWKNSKPIEEFEELKKLSNFIPNILSLITKEDKKEIVKRFLEEIANLNLNDVIIEMPFERKLIRDNFEQFESLSLLSSMGRSNKVNILGKEIQEQFDISYNLNSMIYIEQIYEELVVLYNQLIEKSQIEVNNTKQLVENLRTKFSDELMLQELEKTND